MSAGSGGDGHVDGRPGLVGRGLLAALRWYRDAVSPALPPRCRFYPTCSAYALTAVQRYGTARGSWLAMRRIIRCGPWHPGGVDHVPLLENSHGERALEDPGKHVAGSAKDVGPQGRSLSQETAVV
ncbi:MAG: membrane protein insertion efficiency factor YidD [Actinomycetota bacterium]|nr:membrane protein insertion efficiency factor YidD [Actinomycetota bacterium]